MKILYVAPENVTGGFKLFAEGHSRRGNECRWITFFGSEFGFDEDLCFDLRGMPVRGWVRGLRTLLNRYQSLPDLPELEGDPPIWKPASLFEDILYRVRDITNANLIRRTIASNRLNDFDLYHFEQGIDPFRDGRWVTELNKRGKGIVSFYHGTDIRNRGVIPAVYSASTLNLTSEIDLLRRIPGMKYLYLPIDAESLPKRKRGSDSDRLKICHAARNRAFKGSDHIESIVKDVQNSYDIEWVMIENVEYKDALKIKAECDIYIDQITDSGGWGYGASSVESLAMGIPTLTMINPRVVEFLRDHPFINVDKDSLKNELIRLIESPDKRSETAEKGLSWVLERHGIESVMQRLYEYYREAGLI